MSPSFVLSHIVVLGKLKRYCTCLPREGLSDAQPEAVTVRFPMLQHSTCDTLAAQSRWRAEA